MAQNKLNTTQLNLSGVQSYVNSGSAGGTFFYVNLGGLKLLWGVTALPANATSTQYGLTVNFPAGFFDSIQSITVSGAEQVGTNLLTSQVGGVSGTSYFGINVVHHNTTSSTQKTNVFVIGT